MAFRIAAAVAVLVTLVALALPAPTAAASGEAVAIDVGGREMQGSLFRAKSATGPVPGILVLHTRGGLEQEDLQYAAALADEGYVTLAVSYLDPARGERFHDPRYLDELSRVVDYLAARPEVAGKPIGTVGFSLGSKGVSVAGVNAKIKAVVSYYGVYDLRLLGRRPGGAHLPPMPVDFAARLKAPVLLFHGTRDNETPLDQAEAMRDALVKEGKTVDLVVYRAATHRFDRGAPAGVRSTAARRQTTSREGYLYELDPSAERDAWKRTLDWFRKYLVE